MPKSSPPMTGSMKVMTTMTTLTPTAAASHHRTFHTRSPSHVVGRRSGIPADPPEREPADDEPDRQPSDQPGRDPSELPLAVLLQHLERVGQEHRAHALRHPLQREEAREVL